MVREGAFVADIGSDHAYLPIALCLEGRARGGVASDINAGPVERGRKNIEEYGLADKLQSIQSDGLDGIERFCPEDILILGMGGELIASILSRAPWTRSEGIRLCLQPMTHPELLRVFLRDNGYSIIDERIVVEGERIYQLISAEYSGRAENYSEAQLLLGRINIERGTPELALLAKKHISMLDKRIEGKQSAGESAENEIRLKAELEKYRLSI